MSNCKASRFWVRAGFLVLLWFVADSSYGQDAGGQSKPTLTASGSSEVTLVPEKLRLRLPVRIESRDGEMALKRFLDHQKRVTKDLLAMGASEKSIQFAKPRVSVGIPDVADPDLAKKQVRQQAAQMRNMNPQMKGQFPTPAVDSIDNLDLPRVFAAESALTAEWKLANGLDNAATLLPSKIMMAIDEKDIVGKQSTEVLSDEEQKLIQPLLGNQMNYYQPNQVGDQRLMFVAEMSEGQEQQALAEAVKSARAQASSLAQAAGLRLGNVKSVQRLPFTEHAVSSSVVYAFQSSLNSALLNSPKNEREIVNADPNALRKMVNVTIVFEIDSQ